MNIKEKIGIHNRFDIEVIDSRTGEVKQKARAYNRILNSLWGRLLINASGGSYGNMMGGEYSRYTFYGSGSGTPSASDTSLFHHEGVVENTIHNYGQDSDNHIAWVTKVIQLSEQMAVGVTLTEVGIGYGTASNNLCTHAMLEDMNGNPISIVKTDVDVINIYATIYLHWSTDNYILNANLTYGGGRSEISLRYWLFGLKNDLYYDYPEMIHIYLGKEAILSQNSDNNIANDYLNCEKTITNDVSNKRTVWAITRLGVNSGNMKGGLGCGIIASSGMAPNMFIDFPAILGGTDITNEAIGTGDGETTEFAFDFDFPSAVSVYKNGVKMTSGYTIKNIPAAGGNAVSGVAGCLRTIRDSSTPNNHKPLIERLIQNGASSVEVIGGRGTPKTTILYNRAYEVGVASINSHSCTALQVFISDDLNTWTKIVDTTAYNQTYNLTSEEQHAKYFKIVATISASPSYTLGGCYINCNSNEGKALVFNTAPANGDVITADYHTPYVAKDSDHVYDLSITWQFGEYTE